MEPHIIHSSPKAEVSPNSAEANTSPLSGVKPEQQPRVEAGKDLPLSPVAVPPTITPPGQLPIPQATPQPASSQPAQDLTTPLVANDDEVIEQEWVQRAKKIVEQTKDDPYSQEEEISRLQADYIKKRYGKEVKSTSD